MKNRTIVFRAAGSGALIGAGAGLLSYPFANSTSTIFAGAAVGAVLGTIYGYHLISNRDDAYQRTEFSPASQAGVFALQSQAPQRKSPTSFEVGLPLALLSFDLR